MATRHARKGSKLWQDLVELNGESLVEEALDYTLWNAKPLTSIMDAVIQDAGDNIKVRIDKMEEGSAKDHFVLCHEKSMKALLGSYDSQAIQSDTGWELNCERLGIDTGEKKKSKGINIELPS